MIFKNSIRKVLYYCFNEFILKSKKNDYPLIIHNDLIGQYIIFFDFFEKDLVESILNSFSSNVFENVCVDVGANIGNHTVQYAKKFKKVISFEPQKRTFKILDLNTSVYSNIHIYNFGLSNVNTNLTFKIPFENTGAANQNEKANKYYKENVEFKNFDKTFDDDLSYVKIDVEGNELDVLMSMTKSIRKSLPIISFELNQNKEKNTELLDFLISNGYNDFFVKKEHFIDKFWRSKNKLILMIKFLFKLITKSPQNKLIKISVNEISLLENYELLTVSNNNSKYKII